MQDILSKENIFLDIDIKTKKEIFEFATKKLFDKEVITNKEAFIEDLYKREEITPTGFENGIAIPHTQSKYVNTPTLVCIRTKDAMEDWESLNPDNKVKLIFLIAVPNNSEKDTHLKVLSTLAVRLMDTQLVEKLYNCTKDEFVKLLQEDTSQRDIKSEVISDKVVVAVTACATGIAHTYMAAEALEKYCQEKGYEIHVEKQGASGLEDKLTKEIIKKADVVILAHDVVLKETARFNGKKFLDVKVAAPIKNTEQVVADALSSTDVYNTSEEEVETSVKTSKSEEIMQAIMTGISHMIPVIVAGGLLMGIAKLSCLFLGGQPLIDSLGDNLSMGDDGLNLGSAGMVFLAYLDKIGSLLMLFMYPVFAAYLAYSIGGKNAFMPGLLGGIFAAGLHTKLWGFSESPAGIMSPIINNDTIPAVPSGFLGALALGILAGYVVKSLNKLNFRRELLPMKTMLVVPGLAVLTIVIANLYVIEPVFGSLNFWLQILITNHSSSEYIYGVSIASATAFDLGGPVNKAAGTVAMALAGDGTIDMTARTLSIVIPPMGLGLATIIDKLVVGKRVFSEEERTLGQSSLLLGFLAISEGGIPFMIKNPKIVIPINILGAIVGSVVAIFLGAKMWLPIPAFWGWPLVEGVVPYLIGLFVGVCFVAFANIFVRFYIEKRGK